MVSAGEPRTFFHAIASRVLGGGKPAEPKKPTPHDRVVEHLEKFAENPVVHSEKIQTISENHGIGEDNIPSLLKLLDVEHEALKTLEPAQKKEVLITLANSLSFESSNHGLGIHVDSVIRSIDTKLPGDANHCLVGAVEQHVRSGKGGGLSEGQEAKLQGLKTAKIGPHAQGVILRLLGEEE